MTEADEIAQIRSMPPGKSYGICQRKEDAQRYGYRCIIRRQGEGYEVEACWVTPAAYDEDPDSISGNPFGVGASFARRVKHVATAEEAAELLSRAARQLKSR